MKIMPEILENEEHMVLGDAVYFPDMEHNFYHSVPGISSSNSRRFGQSQLHAFALALRVCLCGGKDASSAQGPRPCAPWLCWGDV